MPLTLADRATRKPVKTFRGVTPLTAGDVEGEPRRVLAYVIPLRTGWTLIPVEGSEVRHNGSPLLGPSRLSVGDLIAFGTRKLMVSEALLPAPAVPPLEPAPDVCEVTVRFRDAEIARTTADGRLVVGVGTFADLDLPLETGLAPCHALLFHLDDEWHLFDLSGCGLVRFGDAPRRHLVLSAGESAWLLDLELTVNYRPVDPLDREPLPEPLAAPASPDAESVADMELPTSSLNSEASDWVLEEPDFLDPADPEAVCARVSWLRSHAGDWERPLDERIADLEQAEKHVASALTHRPNSGKLREAQRDVGAELTLLRILRARRHRSQGQSVSAP